MALHRPSRRALLAAAAACGLAATALPAIGQAAWPDKPLRIMVGASPGGGTDILARMLADRLGPTLKQTVVVENRPGASNTIAAEMTAKAAPDGYTLLLATNTGQAVAPHLLKLKFDPLKDLQPLGLVAVMPNVLVVSAEMDDDLAYAITKAMFENIADLQAVHPAANETTVEFTLSATPVPLHPGAIRYFEEIGATIPDRLRP